METKIIIKETTNSKIVYINNKLYYIETNFDDWATMPLNYYLSKYLDNIKLIDITETDDNILISILKQTNNEYNIKWLLDKNSKPSMLSKFCKFSHNDIIYYAFAEEAICDQLSTFVKHFFNDKGEKYNIDSISEILEKL